MSYLYGLGNPLPIEKWVEINEPKRSGIWEPTTKDTFYGNILTLFDDFYDQDEGDGYFQVRLGVRAVNPLAKRVSNSTLVKEYSEHFPFDKVVWFDNEARVNFARFMRPLLKLFIDRISPVGEDFILNFQPYLFGQSFFRFIHDLLGSIGHYSFYLNQVELLDNAGIERLLDIEKTTIILGQQEPLELGIPDPNFRPKYTRRAETSFSEITINQGELFSAKVDLRDIATNKTQGEVVANWSIVPFDKYTGVENRQGSSLEFVPTTSVTISAEHNGHTSTRKTIYVQQRCIRCQNTYIIGVSGDYACQWNAMVQRPGGNEWYKFQGRHSTETLTPDGIGDIRDTEGNWRTTGSLLVDGTGEIRQNQMIIREEFDRVARGGQRRVEFNLPEGADDTKYRPSQEAEYLAALASLYDQLLFLK